jgi:hypothetical protein
MARKLAPKHSLIDTFWNFVEENPKLVATVALEIGILAGQAVASSSPAMRSMRKSMTKRVKAVPQQFANAMPHSLSAAALKFLPGPSPLLQPRKRPAGKTRKAKIAHRIGTARVPV